MAEQHTLHNSKVDDKAGKEYWDGIWNAADVPAPIDPRMPGVTNYGNRRFDTEFRRLFGPRQADGRSLLEIGCARSQWLPYFVREFGFRVVGLDYSEIGCEMERQVLANAQVDGDVVCADMFAPPDLLVGAFDVVFSMGVAEHFTDTSACLSAFARFLKPGGTLVTTIPNLSGSIGWFVKSVNRPVYDIHVPLNARQFRAAHEKAGLNVAECFYFLSNNFWVANLNGLDMGRPATKIKWALWKSLCVVTRLLWSAESRLAPLPATMLFAPYIVCIARKSED